MTVMSFGSLLVSEQHIDRRALRLEPVDIVVLAASWDPRCLHLLNTLPNATIGVVIQYENTGGSNLALAHREEVSNALLSRVEEIEVIEADSFSVEELWSNLGIVLQGLADRLGRRVRILIDVTCMPRFLHSALLCQLLRRGELLSSLTMLYSQASAYSFPGRERSRFSTGNWDTVVVPGAYGIFLPDRPRTVVISTGFDASAVFESVAGLEPRRVFVLVPSNGSNEEFDLRAAKSAAGLRRLGGVELVRCEAFSALDVVQKLDSLDFGEDELLLLPSGTKVASVGFALYAAKSGRGVLLYRRPNRHVEVHAQASGRVTVVTARDVSSIR